MMKQLMIGALSLGLLAPTVAEAQSRHGRHDRDHRYDRRDRHVDRHDRRDHRRWERDLRRWEQQQRREYRRWARGQVIPYNHRRSWYVRDYHRYGWAPPPRGYGYYRTDTGDIVLAAIATGVILSLIR